MRDDNRRRYRNETFEHLWARSVRTLAARLDISEQAADAMLRRNQGASSRVAELPRSRKTEKRGKRVQDAELAQAVQNARPLLPHTIEQRARMTAVGMLRDSALWYAKIGWPVFPLAPGGKVPIVPRGHHEATADVATISRWWEATPHANIGTPTGFLFDVIDIDMPDGPESWARTEQDWRDNGWRLPTIIAVAETGNGGRHLLIEPQGVQNSVALEAGLDYRGTGGYIVLPPSQLSNGGIYDWITWPK